MKFTINSKQLLEVLQVNGKAISNKPTLPILDNFLFELSDRLTITASDLETTLVSELILDNLEGSGSFTVDAKRLQDIVKELADQPIQFEVSDDNKIDILSGSGKFSIVGQGVDDYPKLTAITDGQELTLNPDTLSRGINNCLFAAADDDMRPIMNGILFEIKENAITFVSTDAHKLVRYSINDISLGLDSSFILPKKPANLIKGILTKSIGNVEVSFNEKNAIFDFGNVKMICRLIEGVYPNYNAVIPKENSHNIILNRIELLNSLKRVSIFANRDSNVISFNVSGDSLNISAQDIDFSVSANEEIMCQYGGDGIVIGFKSQFMIEMLSNLSDNEVCIDLSDPSKPLLLTPLSNSDKLDVLMLLMPMMVNN